MAEPVISRHERPTISSKTYIFGYLASIAMTVAAYLLVSRHSLNASGLIAAIAVLAASQFMVQVYCFLHLGNELKPRLRLFVFLFMVSVVAILVIGSLWIMYHLNYNMTPQQFNTYLNNQGGGF